MADPVTIALVGAGTGAVLDKENPLRGAMLGGIGGYFAGPALAGALPGASASAAAASTVLPEQAAAMGAGMEALAGGSSPEIAAQIAANAAKSMGVPASAQSYMAAMSNPAAAGLVASPVNPAASGLGRIGAFLSEKPISGLPVSRGSMLSTGGQMMLGGGRDVPQNMVVSNPQALGGTPPANLASISPYAAKPEEIDRRNAAFGIPFNNLARLPRVN